MEINRDTSCFFSGPRPRNLASQSYDPMMPSNKRILLKLREVIIDHIDTKGIDTFITGMALGIDLWAARIVMKLREQEKYKHIKLVGAIPCKNQYKTWKKEGKEEWLKVYEACDMTHYVTETNYKDGCMALRNHWMVDHSSRGIAVFNGSSGTAECLTYAVEQGLGDMVTIIKPSSLTVQEGII